MVAASPEVDRFGLSLPKVNRPHSRLAEGGPALLAGQAEDVTPAQRALLLQHLALRLRASR